MSTESMSTADNDELRAGPADPAAGERPRGPLGWFRGLTRARRLAITSSAAVIAVVAALLALGATSNSPAKPAAQPRAPGFTLAALDHPGQRISLAGYAGHPLVVNFFASWCGPCQQETPLIARFYRAAHGSVTVLGVDVNDSATNALKFTHKAGVQYPVVSDPAPMHTTLAYNVPGLPATFFLNSRHDIVKSVYGAVTLQELRTGVAMMTKQTGRS
ncbi:MAG TPA: TlpA disulfide reductase family protein [Streptosporangiaceae bacterium]|nr:TlpA disulfide reductase family protein [Streptosporangiaceae bacterium]